MRRLRLTHWFFIWLLGMLVFVILTQPDERPDKMETISYNTTRSSIVYFNNIRSFYYLKSEEGNGMLTGYRLKSQSETQTDLPFVVYIVNSNGDAYIRLDTAAINAEISGISISDYSPEGDNLFLPDPTQDEQYLFAKFLFQALKSEKPVILLQKSGGSKPLTGDDRTHMKQILTDYFKLIGKI